MAFVSVTLHNVAVYNSVLSIGMNSNIRRGYDTSE